ncbi:MAG TPA: PIG-L deacetylase family protein [Acidimicrobiales bacterium]|nr:PIG-L deacetylase family protein [Acidimicrobiales bacterium]
MAASPEIRVADGIEPGIARVLVVAAHPDDVDFGVAGSVALWTDAGIDVSYCIVTDGDAGGSDRSISRSEMAETRRSEQRAAASVVGVHDLHFLGYTDGALVATSELRRDLSRLLRSLRPDRVVCQSPERNWDALGASHPDHLAAGEATVAAFYPDARNPFAHPELLAEGLEPHVVRELWLAAHPQPNRAVDVTATFDRKIAALRCHVSQVGEGEWLATRVGDWLVTGARRAGLAPGRLAEVFRVVTAP